jgi:hypothetical protein
MSVDIGIGVTRKNLIKNGVRDKLPRKYLAKSTFFDVLVN